jgi:nitrate reductase gamma subunit
MSGIFWPIFTFSAIFIFLVLMVYRILAIISLPVHLRWELAPIPHEKGKGHYGGSYLEEYEWWQKPRRRSRIAPIMYMLREISLLRGVWKHNRSLWPFSFSLHAGIYLIIITIFLHIINALFIITDIPLSILNVFQNIASVLAVMGYVLGSLGAIGLFLKRMLDSNLRPFSTFSMYFRLVFLGTVFISGVYAWFDIKNFASETSNFVENLITLDTGVSTSLPLALHIIISLLFIMYLPFTDMIHFIIKHFTYNTVRWNDEPLDEKMGVKLQVLLNQPIAWSASHVKAEGKKSWTDITTEKTNDGKKT